MTTYNFTINTEGMNAKQVEAFFNAIAALNSFLRTFIPELKEGANTYKCEECEKNFTANRQKRFCTAKCSRANWRKNNPNYAREWDAANRPHRTRGTHSLERTCKCGTVFTTSNNKQKYCSHKCYRDSVNVAAHERRVREKQARTEKLSQFKVTMNGGGHDKVA